jgi:hypothetical protein
MLFCSVKFVLLSRCDYLLDVLFSDRTVELHLDLRKVHASIHDKAVCVLISALRKRPCHALARLELCESTTQHHDELTPRVRKVGI